MIKSKKFNLLLYPPIFIISTSFILGVQSFTNQAALYIFILLFFTIVNFILSSFLILKSRFGFFIYLFNFLFSLGAFLKLVLFQVYPSFLREPIGLFLKESYNFNNLNIILICLVSSLSIFIVLLINLLLLHRDSDFSYTKNLKQPLSIKSGFPFLVISVILSTINLKYNILMFGLKPAIYLPLFGNSIFFLSLFRILPFLYLYVCHNQKQILSILFGALIFLIVSLGVLSRMGIAIYLIVIFLSFVILNKPVIRFKKMVTFLLSVALFLLLTVGLSTSTRRHFNNNDGVLLKDNQSITNTFNFIINESLSIKTFEVLTDLTIARWIGLEGIMAVEAYPNKGWTLFLDALKEPTYTGDSFYNKIIYGDKKITIEKNISTSVPGPVAFFYYTGSKTAVFVFLTIFLLFFSFLERILWKYYSDAFAPACFVIVYTTIDFHQFGIAPLSFFKYLAFTIICLIIFYPLKKYIPRAQHE